MRQTGGARVLASAAIGAALIVTLADTADRPAAAVRGPWHDLAMPEQVTLRPVSEDDLPLLRTLTQDPQVTGEFEQYGHPAHRSARVRRNGGIPRPVSPRGTR